MESSFMCSVWATKGAIMWGIGILTWHRGHRDHEGGSPKVRLTIALRWCWPLRLTQMWSTRVRNFC